MEADARAHLLQLQALGIRLGVLSNRARRFMAHEIYTIDGDGWHELFDTMVCGDDLTRRKPHPDLVLRALRNLQMRSQEHTYELQSLMRISYAGCCVNKKQTWTRSQVSINEYLSSQD